MSLKPKLGPEHIAKASAKDLPVSTKQCVEITRSLRYKNTGYAKKFLEEVSALERAVPYTKFHKDLGHKRGMGPGRYPQKAAKEFLALVKAVESNAQVKGLDISNLKIIKLVANKASIPFTGGRHRHGTKRSHLEIEVAERKKFGEKKRKESGKNSPEVKTEVKAEVKAQGEKKA